MIAPVSTIMSSEKKRFSLVAFLGIHFLLCSTTFAFQQGERIWTATERTTNNSVALPKPPFPNGAAGGRVTVIPGVFDDNLMLTPRDITVWLPPQYNQLDTHRFSVLYCHDGQNVMDDESSWTGASWRLMGALIRLSERGLLNGPPPIVVLLPSAKGDFIPGVPRRHLEYGSLLGLGNMPSFAQAHADIVANVIKPLIDEHFRTNPNSASVMGSSMGGQASMNLLLRHPDLFSAAACLSPYFAPDTLAAVGLSLGKLKSKRIYMDMGGDMQDIKVPYFDVMDHVTTKHWWNAGYFWLDTSLQPSCNVMHKILQFAGGGRGGARNVSYAQIPGARHNERAWANRIHQPLLYLYGKQQQGE